MCHNKSLRVLLVGEDEDSKADLDAKDDGDPPPPVDTQLTLLELSIFSLGGHYWSTYDEASWSHCRTRSGGHDR